MEFTITKTQLEGVLKRIEKCWGNKNVPIMDCIYIKADTNGDSVIRAANGKQHIEAKFNPTVVSDGEACIDAYTFTKVVKTFEEGDVTVQLQPSGYAVDVYHKTGKLEVSGADPNQFPPYTSIQEDSSFIIDDKDLKHAFDNVKFAAIKNPIGSDAKLGGVGFTLTGGTAFLACTDRRRIAKYEFPTSGAADTQVVVPTDILDVLPANAGNINVKIADSGIEIETSSVKYRASVIAQTFPDVSKFFNQTAPIYAFVPTHALLDILERIQIVAKASKASAEADFSFGPTGLMIDFKPKGGKGKINEVISVSNYTGAPINITLNVDIIYDAIKRISKTNTEFEIHAANKPVLIYGEGERDFGFLAAAIV